MTETEFRNTVSKVKGKRKHRLSNSVGVKEALKYYRKIRPNEKRFVLTESQYLSIIRHVNNKIRELLINGKEVTLPANMGKLELRKRKTVTRIIDGKIVTNLPVDWKSTLNLWYEDEDSYNKRKVIRQESPEVFKVFYNKRRANYPNKSFYKFNINREIKKALKDKIEYKELDAPLIFRNS